MKYVFTILFVLFLSAGTSPKIASDARCLEVDNGNRVLSAANRFVRDNKRNPLSLSELAPEYLPVVPEVPTLEYSSTEGLMRFSYYFYVESEEFNCECKAKIRQKEFKCFCMN